MAWLGRQKFGDSTAQRVEDAQTHVRSKILFSKTTHTTVSGIGI
jgi:hypothetical protein